MTNLVPQREITPEREITPANWAMLAAMPDVLAVSQTEKAQIAKKLLFCFENNLPLNLAVNGGLYVVNNRLEMEGIVIRAKIKQHPQYDYQILHLDDVKCVLGGLVNNEPIGTVEYTIEHARRADLLNKENWKKYPEDMLLNRATSRLYKYYLPNLFSQPVYVRGEIQGNYTQQHTDIDQLLKDYSPNTILEAMNGTDGTYNEVVNYLENMNENN